MAVWSKVQGSPKSWSKLKQVCLNGTIQSVVRMCHTECGYEWRLLAYLGDIFLQGVHFSLSESFCDLEPAQWERNSVQLAALLNLKQVCVCIQPEYRPTWTREEQRNPEQKIAVLASLLATKATNVLERRKHPWRWLPGTLISCVGTEGFEGVGTAWGKDQADGWVEVVGRGYWWRWSTAGI